MRTAAWVTLVAVGVGAAVSLQRVRRWLDRWGATDEEFARTLPGDSILVVPHLQTTHAVTIRAPVADVFPWLAQIGQGRGGFYSYDRLENNPIQRLGIHSADRILPEFQDLRRGDEIPVAPGPPFYGFHVADVQAPDSLVLEMRMHPFSGAPQDAEPKGPTLHATWAFALAAADGSSTRLIARTRASLGLPVGIRTVYCLALGLAVFVMERGMLLGVRARAERLSSSSTPDSPVGRRQIPPAAREPELAEASSR